MMRASLLTSVVVIVLIFLVMTSLPARADLAVVVNANNPIDALTLKEIKQLYFGRMRRFPGVNMDVDLLDREESSATYQSFYKYVMEIDSNRLKRYRARYLFSGQGRLPETVGDDAALVEVVRRNTNALGYIEVTSEITLPNGVRVVYVAKLPEPESKVPSDGSSQASPE